MITKKGISASPGVAIGPAFVLDTEEYRIPRRLIDPTRVAAEIRTLDAALAASSQEVAELRAAMARRLGEKAADIFAYHGAFIADPKLRNAVTALIEQRRYTAAYAFGQIMNARQRDFRNVPDPYIRERVRDLFDIERRVLRHILGKQREDITKLTEPVVVVAHDITPSQAVSLDRDHILGFATNVGGQTSHLAIIAKMSDIPAVVALNDVTSDVAGGETIIIDGTHGIVVANPDQHATERYQKQKRERSAFLSELSVLRDLPAVTRDGQAISLQANIELAEETGSAIETGAEGIGLYRTEFLFLSDKRMPSEAQQYEVFCDAVGRSANKPMIIRTVDLGADKLMPSMGQQHDQNPVLGLRALRYCMLHLDMFKMHLRAILRAAAHGDVRIMFPMITTLMELRQAKIIVQDVMEDLEEDGVPFRRDIPIGVMIETPAAAMLSAALAREAEFLSIGTNDLTQYTLAVDRANERVAHLYTPHNPAVLKLIREVVRNGRRAGVAVSLCGEMAGTPLYTVLLIGLGLRQLSMAPKEIPEIKKIVRSVTINQCEAIARKVMRMDSDRQVLNLLRDELGRIAPEFL